MNTFLRSSAGPRPDEKGRPRESAVREFLKSILPEKYGITTGYVINQNKNITKQCDVIIYNRETCPKFVIDSDDDIRLVPIEEVYGVIEVKSTLDANEFQKAVMNLTEFKKVYNDRLCESEEYMDNEEREGNTQPFVCIFSYQLDKGTHDLFEPHYELHRTHVSLDALFILSTGYSIKATDEFLTRSYSIRNKLSFDKSAQSKQVWMEIVDRAIYSENNWKLDDYVSEDCTGGEVLLNMYTFILDKLASNQLESYSKSDYIALWYEAQDSEK